MKKILYSFIAAGVASLAIVSCNKTEIEAPNQEPTIHLQLTANLDTKTAVVDPGTELSYGVQWTAGDKLGVFEVVDGAVQAKQTSEALDADGETKTFDFNLTAVSGGSAYDYTFVYPADAVSKGGSTESPFYRLSIADKQTFPANSFDKNADVLVSEHKTLTEQPTSLTLNFARLGATARMVLTGVTSSEIIKTVKFSTTEGNIAGYKKYNPQTGVIDADGAGVYSGQKEIELTPEATDLELNGNVVVWFRLYDITLTSNFTVFVKTDAAEYTKAVDLATPGQSLEFKNGALTKFTVDLSVGTTRVDPNSGKTYNLVNSLSDVVDGATYLIVAENEGDYYALGEQNTNNRRAAAVTENNGVVTVANANDIYPVIVEAVTGGYTLKDVSSNSYLYASSTSANQLKSTSDLTDTKTVWTIEISNGVAHITNVGNTSRGVMRFNPNNGSPLFAAYGSTSTTGTADLALYVDPDSLVPDSRETVTLSFNPAAPAAITLGDDFNEPTLNVDPAAAASAVTYSVTTEPAGCATIDASSGELNIIAAGTITVKAEIPDGNATYKPASATYTLTVNAATTPTNLTLPFTETFDGSDGTMGWSGSVASGTIQYDNDGWDATNPYGADGAARFGKGSGLGKATTPSIYYAGNATITFKAGAWNGGSESTNLKVSVSSGSIYSDSALTTSASSVTLVKGAFTEYTLYLKDLVSPFTFTFEGNAETNSRFFLDDVSIVEGIVAPAASFGATINNSDNVPGSGGTKSITVSGNVDWTVTAPAGVTVEPASGNGAATITVTIPANTSTTDTPSYTVTVATTATVDPNSYSFVINQDAASGVTNTSTEANPYTPDEAVALADQLSGSAMDGVYVYGIISKITTAYNSTYKNVSFDISADGTTSGTQFRIYRAPANSADDFVVGDAVEFVGVLKTFGTTNITYELDGSVTSTAIACVAQLHKPVIDPNGGSFTTSQDVTITADSGASILYSVDGTEPATVYTDALSLTETTTVKAKATKGILTSGVVSAEFTKGGGSTTPSSVTYDFTGTDWSVSNGTLTNGTVSFTGEGGTNFKMNSGYFFMGKSGAYLTFPTYSNSVSKIVVTGNTGASGSVKQNIYVGDTAVSSETTGATGTNTYNIASGYQAAGTVYTLKVTSNHNTQITQIEVFFE